MEEVRLHRVHHVEEILPRRAPSLRENIRKVLGDVDIAGELWPERLHRQLIVMWHLDICHIFLLEELLLVRKHLLQEVLVDRIRRWEVVLH